MIAAVSRTGVASLGQQQCTPPRTKAVPSNCSLPSGASRSLSRAARRSGSVAARVALNDVAVKSAREEEKDKDKEEESAFEPAEEGAAPPTAFEVQSLLMELCDETSIAELKIKVGSFLLHVKRDLHGKGGAPAPVFFPPHVSSFPMSEAYAEAPPPAAPKAPEAAAEAEVDEGLLYVSSPTVGILRRGRIYKGKRGRNLVEAGSAVKAGQVLCYIEQLSTQVAVESEHAGEIVSFSDDGVAIGYGDPIVAIRPSFPGIKKLSKA